MKGFQLVQRFARSQKLDGFPGDMAYGKGRTTTGISIGLGQDNPGNVQLLVKTLCDGYGILPGHGVCYQQCFNRMDGITHCLQLFHEFLVNVQSTRCIQKEHIKPPSLGTLQGTAGNFQRFLSDLDGKCFYVHLLSHCGQLFHGGRAVDVQRRQQAFFALLFP